MPATREHAENVVKYFRRTDRAQLDADGAILFAWLAGEQVDVDVLADLGARAFCGDPTRTDDGANLLYRFLRNLGFDVRLPEASLAITPA